MIIGQDPGKLGAWYEEGFVVLQLLLLLTERVDSVKWEGIHDDGEGIDLWILEKETRVAVQCKTRSRGSWTLTRLAKRSPSGRSILGDAKLQLEGDTELRFRFVHDAQCPDLEKAIQDAMAEEDRLVPLEILKAWGLTKEGSSRARRLLRRMGTVKVAGIDGQVEIIAGLLARKHAGSLIHCLTRLARDSLTVELRRAVVHRAIESASIALEPFAYDPSVHERLEGLRQELVQRVSESRGIAAIERSETNVVIDEVQNAKPGTTVLVHGPAGCGKSEIVAAVVDRLRSDSIPILALTPDFGDAEIGIGINPVAALVRYSAGGSALFVIDQLDQIFMADQPQVMMRRCRGWIQEARKAGLTILVGCRTIDAEKTQLSHLFPNPIRVPVGDFSESVVARVLAANGIAMNDLEPPVRSLARRPICLRLIVEMAQRGMNLQGLRSAITIVDRWWGSIEPILAVSAHRATSALDEVLNGMSEEGSLSTPADGYTDNEAISALVSAGVLIESPVRDVPHVRPFHQILADTRIAQSWRQLDSAAALLNRIGERQRQTWHHARRLRLAVPLILEREKGPEIIDELVRASDLRPLLRRAVLLAIAAIDRPESSVVRLVKDWLDDSDLRDQVLGTVVHRHVEFIDALSRDGWLDESWELEIEFRGSLLSLLASVAISWGDGVAAHLSRWSEADPTILDRAQHVFLHQPGKDTDELFIMRREYLAGDRQRGLRIWWPSLFEESPQRGLELLAILLRQIEPADLVSGKTKRVPDLPAIDDSSAGIERVWTFLGDWWLGLDDSIVRSIQLEFQERPLHRLVEMIARSLAIELHRNPNWWPELRGILPGQLRELDGWLLLRVGANLPANSPGPAENLARWLATDQEWTLRSVDYSYGFGARDLAKEFVTRVAAELANTELRRLESFIIGINDPWTVERETRRPIAMPSSMGRTAFRLLGAMPRQRLSINGSRFLLELERKFGSQPSPERMPDSDWVQSRVPDDVADRWPVDDWFQLLVGPEQYVYSKQLWTLARRDPRRYLAHALAVDQSIPGSVRESLLASVSTWKRPGDLADAEPWERLEDTDVVDLVSNPDYLDEPACAKRITWIVAERARALWPDCVTARLKEMTESAVSEGIDLADTDHMALYRWNETACSALQALAQIARFHPERRAEVLEVAARAAGHDDLGRRVSAAAAAIECRGFDSDAVVRLILEVSVEASAAAEPEIVNELYRLSREAASNGDRKSARSRLLALSASVHAKAARRGGEILVLLRRDDSIGESALNDALAANPDVRFGAAKMTAGFLKTGSSQDWLRKLALYLADDTDDHLAALVIEGLAEGPIEGLIDDPVFFGQLMKSKAAGPGMRYLLDACDRSDRLLPVAGQIIQLARASGELKELPPWERWESREKAVDVLARLAEEAERERDFAVRTRAFDAWDELLASDPVAMRAFDLRLQSDTWDVQEP